MSTYTTNKIQFPLPRGYFGDIQFSKEQKEYYRAFCENQVQRGLLDEKLHDRARRRVDAKKWKPVKSLTHMYQLYRRRDGGLHTNDGKPSMLGVGRVEGSIEDALYGAYDQTDDELRMTAELVNVDFVDGIVLQNMERGSVHDPYRYLGIKWILTPLRMPSIMFDRDWVIVESSGISTDDTGRRFGYHTLFSVDLPFCPEFPGIIRGKMWYTFIYRDAGRGMIDVHSQGYFDCLGEIIDYITIDASSHMLNGAIRYMKSAEAKKLTILALETLERKIESGGTEEDMERDVPSSTPCSICSKNKSSLFSSRRVKICRVCDEPVCTNCRVKKNILVGSERIMKKVAVCQRCIAHAKTLLVEPANERFVISREMQLGTFRRDTVSTISSEWETLSSDHHFFGTLKLRTFGASFDEADIEYSYAGRWDSDLDDDQLSVRSATLDENALRQLQGNEEHRLTEQDELYLKMLELQEAARKAHYLTKASEVAMNESITDVSTEHP